MSRLGQLWRGDLAQQIEEYLAGALTEDALVDWAMDHPFFDDQSELDRMEQGIIAQALGRILALGEVPPTTRDALAQSVEVLWQRQPFVPGA